VDSSEGGKKKELTSGSHSKFTKRPLIVRFVYFLILIASTLCHVSLAVCPYCQKSC
jgi:hypothetical protein